MQPSLPLGTILQNHYRLTKILGQGGFGRTYLAEDQARFNELCVLKEYTPRVTEKYALHKSKELFQREAEVLYKIQHPQIPKFRGTFEQGHRLFLVQDYAEGKSYSTLLKERLQEGSTFLESEIIVFLQQMLPVLGHIHEKGIIHRDISPDNIILRDSDRLPILIDFGAVKEKAAQLDSVGDIPPATTVGKLGYAPPEQLQTGEVHPNSDLYALAVTAVVLMTGRKPQELLDQSTMTWRWELLPPTISLGIANLLKKMMAPRPHNRYQSVTEVQQALRAWGGITTTVSSATKKKAVRPKPMEQRSRTTPMFSMGNNLAYLPFIGAAMGLLSIFGLFFLFSLMVPSKRAKISPPVLTTATPIAKPSASNNPVPPSVTPSSTPTSTPTSIPEPINTTESVSLALGQTTSKLGHLKANQKITYTISGQQGQNLTVSITKGDVGIDIIAPNNVPIATQVKQRQVTFPLNGIYSLELTLAPMVGVGESDYQLNLSLANSDLPIPSESSPLNIPLPSMSPLPSPPNGDNLEGLGETAPSDR